MKKIYAMLFALALLSAFALPSLAADPTHRMMHGDNVQDALLVGEVIEVEDSVIIFEVMRTVNGKPARSPFHLTIDDHPVGGVAIGILIGRRRK